MNYEELADGVHHFKETEEGRDVMCESVKNFAEEYAEEIMEQKSLLNVKKLMENMNLTLTEAMDNLDITEKEREYITEHLQK